MLNEKIKELRLLNGFNQVELAKRLGLTKQTISNWENNNIQPSIEMLEALADLFSVSTDYLLGRENNRELNSTGLTNEQLKATVTFDITIELISKKTYRASVTLELPIGDIINNQTTNLEITDLSNIVFKRIEK